MDIQSITLIGGTHIPIAPASFYPEQRIEASEKATAMGMGLRMEVHSSHTEFWADATVPVGRTEVYCAQQYKGLPIYETTLYNPADEWFPAGWRTS